MQGELFTGKLEKRIKLPPDLLINEESYRIFCATASFDGRPLNSHIRHIFILGLLAKQQALGKETMRALLTTSAPNRTETLPTQMPAAPERTETPVIAPRSTERATTRAQGRKRA